MATINDAINELNKPTVTGLGPNSGPEAGATSVTITGTNFVTGAAVGFGGSPATNVVVVNGTTITATAPAGTGTVDVTVTTPAGTSSTNASDRYTYVPAPASAPQPQTGN